MKDARIHFNTALGSEKEARDYIARYGIADHVMLIHSPHPANPVMGGVRLDYIIASPDDMIRSWEREIKL